MKSTLLTKEIESNIKLFEIKPNTKVIFSITNNCTLLKQSVQIERRHNDFLKVTLIEYGGTIFKMYISLTDKKFSLYFPDVSQIDGSSVLSIQVIRKILDILAVQKSTKILTVSKSKIY